MICCNHGYLKADVEFQFAIAVIKTHAGVRIRRTVVKREEEEKKGECQKPQIVKRECPIRPQGSTLNKQTLHVRVQSRGTRRLPFCAPTGGAGILGRHGNRRFT